MRIYLPGTVRLLRASLESGQWWAPSSIAFAVTDALVREYPDTDTEELEYLAMSDAARASLRLLAGGQAPEDPAMRVVAAADVSSATPYPAGDRAAVTLAGPVPWSQVAAAHLDGADAADAVRAAVEAVDAADLGDLDAEFAVGEIASYELAWYAPDEISYLLTELR